MRKVRTRQRSSRIASSGFRTWRSTILLMAFVILMAACGNGDSGTEGSPAPNDAGATDQGQAGGETTELVVYGQSGSLEEVMKEEILPNFEEEHNVEVIYSGGTSGDNLAKIQAEQNNPQADVITFNDVSLVQAKRQELLQPLDRSIVTNLEDAYEVAIDEDDMGIAQGIAATVIGYNSKVFEEQGLDPPTSWLDLWNDEYADHLVIHSISNGFGSSFFAAVNKVLGGDMSNADPAFERFAELSPNVLTFASTSSDFDTLFQQETAWIGQNGNTRLAILQDSGVPIEIVYPEEGGVYITAQLAVVKDAPHPEMAQEFINYIISEEVQEIIASTQYYGPVNRNVELDDRLASIVPYGEEQVNALIQLDWGALAENLGEWSERWAREVEN